jgi:hypothetical protein
MRNGQHFTKVTAIELIDKRNGKWSLIIRKYKMNAGWLACRRSRHVNLEWKRTNPTAKMGK